MKERIKAFFTSHLFRKVLLYISLDCLISFVIGFYVSGFLHSLFKANKLIYNPVSFFTVFSRYGFPKTMFWLFFAIMFFLIGIGMFKRGRMNAESGVYDEDRNFVYSKSGEYGTAHYLTDKEMKDVAVIQHENDAKGPIIGQKDTTGKNLIVQVEKSRINRHICVFGSSQSGKTVNFVKPSILQMVRRRESGIVTDPKGELYETTAPYLRKMGYTVRVLNLKNPKRSDGWDMLKELFRSDMGVEQRSQTFANIVIHNMSNGVSSNDIHDSAPELLLNALLMRVALDDTFDTPNPTFQTRTFAEILKILEHPQGAGYIDGTLFSPEDGVAYQPAINCYNRFKMASDNLYGNIIVGLATKLNALTSNVMRKLISTDDIDLSLPGKKPCVYFVITSDSDRSLDFVCALFFSFLFLDLMELADASPNRELPVPVNFIMDEFYNCGTVPNFDGYVSVVRSRLMYISVILQDLPQLRNRYPRTYQSILSNCATTMSIGCNDEETARFFSMRSGETTIKVKSVQGENQPRGLFEKPKENIGTGRRNLLGVDEMLREGFDDEVVVFQTKNVLRCKKFPVFQHPEYSQMKECKINDYPSIFDDDARAEMRRKEEEYIKKFNRWIDEGGDPFPHIKKKEPFWKPREPKREEEYIDLDAILEMGKDEILKALEQTEAEMRAIHGSLTKEGENYRISEKLAFSREMFRKIGDDGQIINIDGEVITRSEVPAQIPYGKLSDLFDLPDYDDSSDGGSKSNHGSESTLKPDTVQKDGSSGNECSATQKNTEGKSRSKKQVQKNAKEPGQKASKAPADTAESAPQADTPKSSKTPKEENDSTWSTVTSFDLDQPDNDVEPVEPGTLAKPSKKKKKGKPTKTAGPMDKPGTESSPNTKQKVPELGDDNFYPGCNLDVGEDDGEPYKLS